MNVTSRSRYALKIMMDLAMVDRGLLVKRGDIVRRHGIPAKYLDQIMLYLRKSNLVDSVRGRDGGYLLVRNANEITVWDIFAAVEEGLYPVQCVSEGEGARCAYEPGCATREPWQLIFGTVKSGLTSLKLDQLVFQYADEKKMCPAAGIRECH